MIVTSDGGATSAIILRQLIVHQPPDSGLIHIAQFDRQSLLRKVLITDRARETFYRRRAYRRRARVGHRGIRPSVVHRRADFDARRETVEDQPSGLVLQD